MEACLEPKYSTCVSNNRRGGGLHKTRKQDAILRRLAKCRSSYGAKFLVRHKEKARIAAGSLLSPTAVVMVVVMAPAETKATCAEA